MLNPPMYFQISIPFFTGARRDRRVQARKRGQRSDVRLTAELRPLPFSAFRTLRSLPSSCKNLGGSNPTSASGTLHPILYSRFTILDSRCYPHRKTPRPVFHRSSRRTQSMDERSQRSARPTHGFQFSGKIPASTERGPPRPPSAVRIRSCLTLTLLSALRPPTSALSSVLL